MLILNMIILVNENTTKEKYQSSLNDIPDYLKFVTDIKNQCQKAGVAFFFKQWGGTNKKKTGRILEGQTWDEMPVYLVWS